MQDQRIFLYGQEFLEANNIPLILLKAFEQILRVLKSKETKERRKCFESLIDTKSTYTGFDSQLEILKMKINLGNWKILRSVDEVGLLVELIYQWMEFEIKHTIPPLKIKKMLKDPTFKTILKKVHKSGLSDWEVSHIAMLINEIFNESEVEMLKFLCDVFIEIENGNGEEQDCEIFKERLIVLALGYLYDQAYMNSNKEEVEFIFLMSRASLLTISTISKIDLDDSLCIVG